MTETSIVDLDRSRTGPTHAPLRVGEGRKRTALVTSGLGNTMGGLGVLAEMTARALEPHVSLRLWRHHAGRRASIRAASLAAQAALGARGTDFVFYEHVDLARLHGVLPGLHRIPYGVFLVGEELWRPLDRWRRRALERASVLVSISQTTIDKTRQLNPWLKDARVTWLGVPTIASAGDAPRTTTAVIVGRMSPSERRKGHDPILDGWRKIRAAVPTARLVVVGDGGDRARLEARARDEGLEGVEFTGRISDAARDSLYASSSCFLFPSVQEGFGLAAVEAAAAGMAVLGVRGTVTEELFPEGSGVVLVGEPSGDAIADGAIPLLSNPALARSMGERARARVEKNFLEEHFAVRFVDALAPFIG
jgi:glycosyltransferase involved in cell wall biosynthesis